MRKELKNDCTVAEYARDGVYLGIGTKWKWRLIGYGP